MFLGGSTLEAMSLAIENAAVVLIGMSKKYKESPNCRSGNGRVLRCFLRYQSRLINFQDSKLCKKKKKKALCVNSLISLLFLLMHPFNLM